MKRRILSMLLVLMMLLSIMPTAAFADKSSTDVVYNVESGKIYFNKSTGEITDCDSTVTKAVIPSEINGTSVMSIGNNAFWDCSSLTSIKLPNSVKSIGKQAFYNCTSLTSITLPNSVKSIGDYAFDGCSSLTSIEIPNSVTSIGSLAFGHCDSLTSIKIPNSVTSLGDGAFTGCMSLTSINVASGNSTYSSDNGVLFDKNKRIIIKYPVGKRDASYVIPNSVTRIGDGAFYFCTGLTSIEIPNSVTSIDSGAFEYCNSLTDVYYSGSEEQWKAISVAEYNDPLTSATIHYNSEGIQTPLNITLTSKEVSRDTSEIEYELSAKITSTSSKTANYINLTVDLPNGVTSEDVTEYNTVIEKLEPSETVVVKWNVTVPIRPDDANYTFVVKATSDNFPAGVVCTAQDTIIVAGKGSTDYTWIFGEDNYSFLNVSAAFGKGYYISNSDLQAYLSKLSNTEIKQTAEMFAEHKNISNLYSNKLNKWSGSCYGMVLTAAMFKIGDISPAEWGGNTTYDISAITANKNSDFESFINLYHISQASDVAMNSYICETNGSEKIPLKNMWNMALDIGDKNKEQQPYLVTMKNVFVDITILGKTFLNLATQGHAVLCYGAETGKFECDSGDIFKKEKFNKRLLIADPNRSEATYLYISDDFKSALYSAGTGYNAFGYRNATLEELNRCDYNGTEKTSYRKIAAGDSTSIKVSGLTGNATIVEGKSLSTDGLEVTAVSQTDEGEANDATIFYLLKDTADSYTITPYEGSSINTSVYFDDYAVDIDVDAESIDVLKDGKVKLTGATGDAKLGFAINGSSFDFVDISGKCDGDVVIDLNGDSIVISGDISDYSVSNMNRDTNETDAVIHGDRNTKIEKEDNKLKVSTDEDADGVYETELDSNELKHTYDEFKDNGDGTHSVICSVCKHSYVESHVFGEKTCTVCGAKNPDYKPPRPVHIHRYTETVTEPTCTEKGYTTYTCICGRSYVDNYVDALGHTEAVDPAVAATCEKTGLTEGKHCSVCNEVLVAQKETPKTEHKFENGKCSVCGAADPDYVAPVVNPFKDVKEGDAFYDEILWAADKGIIKGDGTGNYNPNDGITRAQIVMILWNAAGNKEASKPSGFADVKEDAWYAKAVAWAVENGITNGTDLGFEPDRVCTRAEIVTFLHRANNKPAPAAAASFTDLTQDWYKDAVAWAVENGITKGVGDNRFAPNDTCTRGQAAAFMYRLAQLAK